MKEESANESVLPSLFWRVDEAEQVRALGNSSLAIYRDDVLRSLKWLFNASAHPENSPIHHHDEVASSVLNFGLSPVTGRLGSSIDVNDFIRDIRRAILNYEPRILKETLKVDVFETELDGFEFAISGSIWCEPLPESFSFHTRIDSESGSWIFTAN